MMEDYLDYNGTPLASYEWLKQRYINGEVIESRIVDGLKCWFIIAPTVIADDVSKIGNMTEFAVYWDYESVKHLAKPA